jgi:hypothetical protein
MTAFNTVPSEEEPLVEKATTKTKTPWRRLACMSAVVSLALGAAAATALRTASGTSMRPAGATMLFGPNPDPDCDNSVHGNAPGYDTDISDKLNEAMNDGGPGFIFRFRFDEQMPCGQTHYDGTEKGLEKICDDKKKYCKNGKCGVAATVLSNWVVTPNPVYCIQNEPDGCHTPTVGYALLDHWTMRGGELEGFAFCSVWKSTSVSGAPDNSSLNHFSAMTRPTWLGRAAKNRHRHAIEQASRRCRGG